MCRPRQPTRLHMAMGAQNVATGTEGPRVKLELLQVEFAVCGQWQQHGTVQICRSGPWPKFCNVHAVDSQGGVAV